MPSTEISVDDSTTSPSPNDSTKEEAPETNNTHDKDLNPAEEPVDTTTLPTNSIDSTSELHTLERNNDSLHDGFADWSTSGQADAFDTSDFDMPPSTSTATEEASSTPVPILEDTYLETSSATEPTSTATATGEAQPNGAEDSAFTAESSEPETSSHVPEFAPSSSAEDGFADWNSPTSGGDDDFADFEGTSTAFPSSSPDLASSATFHSHTISDASESTLGTSGQHDASEIPTLIDRMEPVEPTELLEPADASESTQEPAEDQSEAFIPYEATETAEPEVVEETSPSEPIIPSEPTDAISSDSSVVNAAEETEERQEALDAEELTQQSIGAIDHPEPTNIAQSSEIAESHEDSLDEPNIDSIDQSEQPETADSTIELPEESVVPAESADPMEPSELANSEELTTVSEDAPSEPSALVNEPLDTNIDDMPESHLDSSTGASDSAFEETLPSDTGDDFFASSTPVAPVEDAFQSTNPSGTEDDFFDASTPTATEDNFFDTEAPKASEEDLFSSEKPTAAEDDAFDAAPNQDDAWVSSASGAKTNDDFGDWATGENGDDDWATGDANDDDFADFGDFESAEHSSAAEAPATSSAFPTEPKSQITPSSATSGSQSLLRGQTSEVLAKISALLAPLNTAKLNIGSATIQPAASSLQSIASSSSGVSWQSKDTKRCPKPPFRGTFFESNFLSALGKQPLPTPDQGLASFIKRTPNAARRSDATTGAVPIPFQIAPTQLSPKASASLSEALGLTPQVALPASLHKPATEEITPVAAAPTSFDLSLFGPAPVSSPQPAVSAVKENSNWLSSLMTLTPSTPATPTIPTFISATPEPTTVAVEPTPNKQEPAIENPVNLHHIQHHEPIASAASPETEPHATDEVGTVIAELLRSMPDISFIHSLSILSSSKRS